MNQRRYDYPFAEIIEQPCNRTRFRYECEARFVGSLFGCNSTERHKTWPTIKIHGLDGTAVIIVSCVTKDSPHRPHPHEIVNKDKADQGVFTIKTDAQVVSFPNLGVQCVKKKNVKESLEKREAIRVDPFMTGFDHKNSISKIDLTAVRLCFQVYVEDSKGKCTVPLRPIVSEPIYDKKVLGELSILKLSHCSAPATGGTPMILLCERVCKDDISIVFFEKRNNKIVWEGLAKFNSNDVYRQISIAFESPAYHNVNIEEPVQVFIQLRKLSDHYVSEPLPFTFTPVGADSSITLKRKRQKYSTSGIIDLESEAAPSVPAHCPHCRCFTRSESLEDEPITEEIKVIAKRLLIYRPQNQSMKLNEVNKQPVMNLNRQHDIQPLDLHCRKNINNNDDNNNRQTNKNININKNNINNLQQHQQPPPQQQTQMRNQQQQQIQQNLQQQQQQKILEPQQRKLIQQFIQLPQQHQQQQAYLHQQHQQQQQQIQQQQQQLLQQQKLKLLQSMQQKVPQSQPQQQEQQQQQPQQQQPQLLQQQKLQLLNSIQQKVPQPQPQQQQPQQLQQQQQQQQQPQLLQQLQPQLLEQQEYIKTLQQYIEQQEKQPQLQQQNQEQQQQQYQLEQQRQHQLQLNYQLQQLQQLQHSQLQQQSRTQLMQYYEERQRHQVHHQQDHHHQEQYSTPYQPDIDNNNYDDEDDDEEEQGSSDDSNPYYRTHVIPNRPPDLFKIQKTLPPQQTCNTGQQYSENINNGQNRLENKESTNNNFDYELSELIDQQLSETMNSGLSLLGDEFEINSPSYPATNNNEPRYEDFFSQMN